MKKIHNDNSCGDEIFASCMCFSTFWKKCKNAFLLLLFLKQALWTWKYVQKKLVIGPDFHQKFYQNRVISQKYTMLQKVYIFNSTSRYLFIWDTYVPHDNLFLKSTPDSDSKILKIDSRLPDFDSSHSVDSDSRLDSWIVEIFQESGVGVDS